MESTPSAFLRVQCNGTLFGYGFGMGSIIIIIAVDGVNGYIYFWNFLAFFDSK